ITATDIPDLDNVTSMRQAFAETGIGNVPNMGDWNVSHVVNMREMFKGAQAFDEAIGDWGDDMQNVTNIRDMFFNATAFNHPLNDWNVGNVTDMRGVFKGATTFDQPLDNWEVGSVTNM